jgi:hypothetical protein
MGSESLDQDLNEDDETSEGRGGEGRSNSGSKNRK